MKRKKIQTAICLVAGTVLMSSCVGSFAMFNKLADWNKDATDSKFLNELIFIVISPAYAFAGLADILVLNSIEFWTGDNPMAKNIGKTKNVKGDDGLNYAVKYLENGYEITKPSGDVFYFTYNKEENNWYMSADGKETKLIHFNGDGSVKAFLNSGLTVDVTPDAVGVYQLRQVQEGTYYMASR
ncbi:DUF3332 domain-containing protein [Prevotella sp. HUN102]|uniref:DUF3332 domain-containing protein n=1 Tax=Prevotella sp. HUN102 TaxID=1392486 RepID=UPI00048B4758|nr:DUF3332 domain-containing protein [Prevotella sp. HUN102]